MPARSGKLSDQDDLIIAVSDKRRLMGRMPQQAHQVFITIVCYDMETIGKNVALFARPLHMQAFPTDTDTQGPWITHTCHTPMSSCL